MEKQNSSVPNYQVSSEKSIQCCSDKMYPVISQKRWCTYISSLTSLLHNIDIGMQKYKREMQRYKSIKKQSEPSSPSSSDSESKKPKKSVTKKKSHSALKKEAFKPNTAPAEKTPISNPEEKIVVTRHQSQPSSNSRASLSHNKPGVSTSYSPAMALSSSAFSTSWPSTNPSHLAQFNPFTSGVCKSDENSSESRERSGSSTVQMHDDDILNMWRNH